MKRGNFLSLLAGAVIALTPAWSLAIDTAAAISGESLASKGIPSTIPGPTPTPDRPSPGKGAIGPRLGRFWTTYYYVPNEADYPAIENAQVRDISGALMELVNGQFKKDVDIEGTGIIRSGKTINFAARVNNEIRYRYSRVRWGWGVGACPLQPYRTIAVDPKMIPLGTVVYIPQARGMALPDGTIHDGLFYADDIGSAINHNHLDLFAAEGILSGRVYEKAGIKTGSFVDVYFVANPLPNGCQSQPPENRGSKHFRHLRAQAQALRILADEFAATEHEEEMREALDRLNELHSALDDDHGHSAGGIDSAGAAGSAQGEAANSDLPLNDELLLSHLDTQRASIKNAVKKPVSPAAAGHVRRPPVLGDGTTEPAAPGPVPSPVAPGHHSAPAPDSPVHGAAQAPKQAPAKRSSEYANEFNGEELKPGEVVFTFDDGPHPRFTPVIVQTLKDLGVPAAFFEVGEMVEAHPELTRLIAKTGLAVANHSYNHPLMTKLSDAEVANQFNRTQKIIQTAVGGPDLFTEYINVVFGALFKTPRTLYFPEFFRHPYGGRDARTMKIATDMIAGTVNGDRGQELIRLKHIMWNIDSLDWQDHSPSGIEARVFNQLHLYKRGVILMHDIHPQSMEAAQLILPRLKREGYKLLSLYDLLLEAGTSQEIVRP